MSYCRWSSMDFKCDLYVYEASDGIVIHVASNRVVGDVPVIDWSSAETLHSTYKAQMEFLDTAEREPINLTIMPLRPNRSTSEPAITEETKPEIELKVIKLVTAASGSSNLSEAKIVRKGQTMVVPVVETMSPKHISQNWKG